MAQSTQSPPQTQNRVSKEELIRQLEQWEKEFETNILPYYRKYYEWIKSRNIQNEKIYRWKLLYFIIKLAEKYNIDSIEVCEYWKVPSGVSGSRCLYFYFENGKPIFRYVSGKYREKLKINDIKQDLRSIADTQMLEWLFGKLIRRIMGKTGVPLTMTDILFGRGRVE